MQGFGILREMNANSGKRGRPALVYYLNEEQALLLCMFSRTEIAKAVRAEVIRVFQAYRRGELTAAVSALTTAITCQ